MIEMELNKIIIDEKRQDQIIVLKEKDGDRLLPIVIGFLEAGAIKMRLSGVLPPRPMTHDLLESVFRNLGARLRKVVIDKLENGTFHAKLVVEAADGKEVLIDARPSDSIAIAVRTKTPVFVAEEVVKQAEAFPTS